MPGQEVVAFILGLAAIVVALRTIWTKGIRPVSRAIKVLHATYDSVSEQDTRLRTVEKRSEELLNNSGSSLRDAIDRIEAEQANQGQTMTEHLEWSQAEILKVWQSLAARDTINAAEKTAEKIEKGVEHVAS